MSRDACCVFILYTHVVHVSYVCGKAYCTMYEREKNILFFPSFNQWRKQLPEFALLTLGEPNCGGGLPRDSSPSLAILWSCSLCSCWIMLSMLGLCSWAGWSPGEESTGGTGAGSSGWGWSSTRASRSPITSCEPEEKISLLCSTVHGTYHNTSDEIIDLFITCFK